MKTHNINFDKIFHLKTFEGYVRATLEITVNFGIDAYAELRTYSGVSTAISCDFDLFDSGEKLLGFEVDEITMSGYVNVTYIMADNRVEFEFGHNATFNGVKVFFKELGNFQISGGHDIDGDLNIEWETETFSENDMVYPEFAHPSKIIITTDGGITGTFGGPDGFKIEKYMNGNWKTICNLKGSINLEGNGGEIVIDIYYKKVFAYEQGRTNYYYYVPSGFDIDANSGAGGGGGLDVILQEIDLGIAKLKYLRFEGSFSVDLTAGGSYDTETGEVNGDFAVEVWSDRGVNGSVIIEDLLNLREPNNPNKKIDLEISGEISIGSSFELYLDVVFGERDPMIIIIIDIIFFDPILND